MTITTLLAITKVPKLKKFVLRTFKLQTILLAVVLMSMTACVSLITPTVQSEVSKLKSGQYSLDKSHASLLFKVRHLGLSTYVGRFNKFDANLDFDPANIEAAQLNAVIEMGSLDINNPSLKDDLMGGTWFSQAKYPQARFSTVSVKQIEGKDFEFTGNLEWRGVTKPIVLLVTFHGGANNVLTGKYTLGFSAQGEFKRSDFGMDAYIPLVGDEVKIEAEAEFLRN